MFFLKDEQYAFEKEYRLLTDLSLLGGVPIRKDDFYRRIPVGLEMLIQYIQPHPDATTEIRRKLGELVSRYLPFMQDT